MKRVLVIGGTGFIGLPIVRRLLAHGADVFVCHRGGQPEAVPQGAHSLSCERTEAARLAQLAQAERIDTVVDVLAYALSETRPLVDSFSGRIDHYLLIGSADVYRNYEGLHRKAQPDPITGLLDEDSPLRTIRYPYQGADGRSTIPGMPNDYDKIPIEEAVREQSGFAWSVARLPMVFGPGDKQRRFAGAIWRMHEERPVIPLERGWAHWKTSFGFVEDVGEGVALMAMDDRARGQVFNLALPEPMSALDVHEALARITGWQGKIVLMDAEGLPKHLGRFAENLDLRYPLKVGSRRIRDTLGYTEITPFDTALKSTIEDELSRPRPKHLNTEYAAEDNLF